MTSPPAMPPAQSPGDRAAGSSGRPDAIRHEHPDVNSGWLRASVFGAMDGLVSNFALIAGMVGGITAAGADTRLVVLAGAAGLLGGSLSMAAGEYTSVASQAEYALAQVAVERREIVRNPRGEAAELAAMYVAKGVDRRTAELMAEQIHRDVEQAVAVHAMEEFGVHPDDVPSPKVAAASSFLSFAAGAAVPLAPYALGLPSLWLTLVTTLTALFLCGAAAAKVTIASWWWSGLRQVLLGGGSAAVTYLLGSLVGAGLG